MDILKMNKMAKTAALIVALMAAFSFAQEENKFKVGTRLGFNLYDITTGKGLNANDLDIGWGLGGGFVFNIPIVSIVSFNPELDLLLQFLCCTFCILCLQKAL